MVELKEIKRFNNHYSKVMPEINKIFEIISKLDSERIEELNIVVGVLQAIRDDCPIEKTLLDQMFQFLRKHTEKL